MNRLASWLTVLRSGPALPGWCRCRWSTSLPSAVCRFRCCAGFRKSTVWSSPANRGKALIAALAGTMIPATSGMGAASALKAVPVLGLLASGFVMPALSAGATFAIGKAFIQHFESGGTLLDFNPPDYRDFVKAQKEMWKSRPAAHNAEQPSSSS